jgi:hypothetical protein
LRRPPEIWLPKHFIKEQQSLAAEAFKPFIERSSNR